MVNLGGDEAQDRKIVGADVGHGARVRSPCVGHELRVRSPRVADRSRRVVPRTPDQREREQRGSPETSHPDFRHHDFTLRRRASKVKAPSAARARRPERGNFDPMTSAAVTIHASEAKPQAESWRGNAIEFLLVGGATPILLALAWWARAIAGADASELAVGFLAFHAAYLINDPHFAVTYLLFYEDAQEARARQGASQPAQRAALPGRRCARPARARGLGDRRASSPDRRARWGCCSS